MNWNDLKVDTPIFVKDNPKDRWQTAHFSDYTNGMVFAWANGETSETTCVKKYWKYATVKVTLETVPRDFKIRYSTEDDRLVIQFKSLEDSLSVPLHVDGDPDNITTFVDPSNADEVTGYVIENVKDFIKVV